MGCFISKEEDDEYKVNMKTAKLVSRLEPEDTKARQEIDEKNIARALELSLMENGKTKQEDQQITKTNKEASKKKGSKMHSDDDKKEAVNPPPQPTPLPPQPAPPPPPPSPSPPPLPPPASISDRGKSVIEGVISVNSQGLCCQICHEPFAKNEIAEKEKYHKHCYKEHRNPYCYVCKGKFPLTEEGRKYNWHPFWKQKYCPSHDNDGTLTCCSCERLQPQGMNYVSFEDDRRLCLECMESSVMDSWESQHLQKEIRGFFDGLYMKINEKEFPIHLVKKQALSRAVTEEKIDYHTRGLCLSQEQSVPSIIKGPRMGPDKQLTDIVTERKWVNGCILIIYGLPRLLTGYILAHEMMHAWLRLNGYRDLKLELEEGLCQMLALRWLESLTYAFPDTAAASAASSSSTTPAASTLKKGDPWSDFEKKLIKFCIYQIKEDDSVVYGKGFQQINDMMLQNDNYTIKKTVQEIVRASKAKAIPDAKL